MSAQTLLWCSVDGTVSLTETWSHTYFMNVRVPHVWRHSNISHLILQSYLLILQCKFFLPLHLEMPPFLFLFFFSTFSQFVPGLYSNESFLSKLFSFVNCLLISFLLSRERMHTLEIFFQGKRRSKGIFTLLCFYFCFCFVLVLFAFVHLVAYFHLFPYEGHGRSEGRTKGTGR